MSEPRPSDETLILVPFFDSLLRHWAELPPEERDVLGVDTMRRAEALLRLPGPWSAFRLREGLRACVARTRAQGLALERAFTETFGSFDRAGLHRVYEGDGLAGLVRALVEDDDGPEGGGLDLAPGGEEDPEDLPADTTELLIRSVREAAATPRARLLVLVALVLALAAHPASPVWNLWGTQGPDDDDSGVEAVDDDDSAAGDDDSGGDDDSAHPVGPLGPSGPVDGPIDPFADWRGQPAPVPPVLTPIPHRLITPLVGLLLGLALLCGIGLLAVLRYVWQRRLPPTRAAAVHPEPVPGAPGAGAPRGAAGRRADRPVLPGPAGRHGGPGAGPGPAGRPGRASQRRRDHPSRRAADHRDAGPQAPAPRGGPGLGRLAHAA